MLIRKEFSYSCSHIVRNCSSERCKFSIHAHTYKLEVILKGNNLDNGQMIYDFGLMKGSMKEAVKMFDESILVWNKDKELVDIAKRYSDRYIILPFSSSAEMQSVYFFNLFDRILKKTDMRNNESNVKIYSVKVHETVTGYAEAFKKDKKLLKLSNFKDIEVSANNKPEWWDNFILNIDNNDKIFINPEIKLQVK